MESTQQSLVRGALFADRYRIERVLGEGGMGRVYLVSDTLLAADGQCGTVALKLLKREHGFDERYRSRFLREVALTREITHPNVIRTFEVGRHQDRLFFTMEYVDGSTLEELLMRGSLKADEAASILTEITEGIKAIHAAGVLHRDLKPANIIITNHGEVKISDFGIAKPALSTMTREHEVLGSAFYMAPEIWRGEEVTSAADIYALGVIAYELFTGVSPIEGTSEEAVMRKHLDVAVAPASSVASSVPAWASTLLDGMLSKNSADRPDCEQILEVLQKYADTCERDYIKEILSRPLPGPSVTDGIFDGPTQSDVPRDRPDRKAKTAEFVREAQDKQLEIASRRRLLSFLSADSEARRDQRNRAMTAARFAGVFLLGPLIASLLCFVVLPQIGRSWALVHGASAGHFVGLSVLMFLSVGLLCAAPAFLAAMLTGSFSRAIELYYQITSKMAALCGLWYIGMHCLQRVGVTPRGQLTSFRASIATIVEQVSEQALRVGFLVPVSAPIGKGATFLSQKYPHVEEGLYTAVLALYFFGVCSALIRVLGGRIDKRMKFLLWVLVGVLPQVGGYFTIQWAISHPGTFLSWPISWQFGPFQLDCTMAGLCTGLLMWGLVVAAGIILSLREKMEAAAPLYVAELIPETETKH